VHRHDDLSGKDQEPEMTFPRRPVPRMSRRYAEIRRRRLKGFYRPRWAKADMDDVVLEEMHLDVHACIMDVLSKSKPWILEPVYEQT